MRRLTTSEFIERSIDIHGNTYDYSKALYTKMRVKVEIICKVHGAFKQAPHSHLNGIGCAKCGTISQQKNRRHSVDDFISSARKVHKEKYDYSKSVYINSTTKLVIICPDHGEFTQSPNSHLSGSGCKACGVQDRANKNKSNTVDFIRKATEVHGDKYRYTNTDYRGTKLKVKITCSHHGEFSQAASDHLAGYGCKLCAKEKARANWIGWGVNKWKRYGEKSKSFESFKVYLILCRGNGEEFIKAGRTFQKLKHRFDSGYRMPYNYTLISKITGTAKHIYNLEKEVFRIPNLKRYHPQKSFGGQYECIDISELDRLKKWFEGKK